MTPSPSCSEVHTRVAATWSAPRATSAAAARAPPRSTGTPRRYRPRRLRLSLPAWWMLAVAAELGFVRCLFTVFTAVPAI